MALNLNTISSITKEQFDELSQDEQKLVLQILEEFSNTGFSQTLNDLYESDFKEQPVDIITFVLDPAYLGQAWHLPNGKCKLFPFWENKLKEIFPDNTGAAVNNIILSGARGLGKSEIAVTIGLYMMYILMCLKDPYSYLNLKATEQVAFAFINITEDLAYDIGVNKFQNTVQASPWFMSRGTITGRTNRIWNPPDFIKIIVGSQPRHVIGQAVFFCFCDEISFIANKSIEEQKRKAIDLIDTAIGGMKTRFTNNGKNPTVLVLASSKRSDKSFLEVHMKKKLEHDAENTLIVDEPVWKVRPSTEYSGKKFWVAQGNRFLASEVIPDGADIKPYRDKGYTLLQVPIEYIANFKEDIDRALCDYAGVSSSDLTKYIAGSRLQAVKNLNRKNPFTREIIEVGNAPDDNIQYSDFFDLSQIDPIMKYKPLFIHLDMSVSGDKTGIAGTWISGKKPPIEGQPASKELYFKLAFSVAVKAPRGYQVSFEKNRQFIYWLKEQGFNIRMISSDSFQSTDLAQQLIAKGYNYKMLSVDRVNTSSKICEPYHYFRSTIYEERIDMYDTELLTEEILGLERDSNGRVDHTPDGINCFTGDTKIKLTDGRSLTILELLDEFNSGKINYVYSVNEAEHKIEAKPIENVWCSGKNAKLVKVTLDNGQEIRCTPEHRFMLRNGTYCEAKDLLPNDSLMPLYLRYPSKGLIHYRMFYDPFTDKWHFEHRQFCTEVYDVKQIVHHKDCNSDNNNPDNLIFMSKAAHVRVHAEMQTGAQSPEANAKRKQSLVKYYQNEKSNDEYYLRWNKGKTVDDINQIHADREEHERVKYELIENLFGFTKEEFCNLPQNRQKMHELKNHTVKSVEILDYTEDVYDITVKDNHNFALNAGVFVHNSKDVSDAVCGSVYMASQFGEEFAYDFGETTDILINANSESGANEYIKQFSSDLLNSLQGDTNTVNRNKPAVNAPKPPMTSADIAKSFDRALDDGILIW